VGWRLAVAYRAAVSQDRDNLIDQRETARAYTASTPATAAPDNTSSPSVSAE